MEVGEIHNSLSYDKCTYGGHKAYYINLGISILSCLMCLLAVYITLGSNPKMRRFPNNLVPLLCFFIAIYEGTNVLITSTKGSIASVKLLCLGTAVISHASIVVIFYTWMFTIVVLHKALVRQVFVFEIERQRRSYYVILIFLPAILVAVSLLMGWYSITLSEKHNSCKCRCVLHSDVPSMDIWLLHIHPVIASAVVASYAPSAIRTLGLSPDRRNIARSRLLMLQDEARRRIVLAIVMAFISVVQFLCGVFMEVAEKDRKTVYSLHRSLVSSFGLVVALIVMLTRKNRMVIYRKISFWAFELRWRRNIVVLPMPSSSLSEEEPNHLTLEDVSLAISAGNDAGTTSIIIGTASGGGSGHYDSPVLFEAANYRRCLSLPPPPTVPSESAENEGLEPRDFARSVL